MRNNLRIFLKSRTFCLNLVLSGHKLRGTVKWNKHKVSGRYRKDEYQNNHQGFRVDIVPFRFAELYQKTMEK